MNLLMLSGDSSVAEGSSGAFYQMLRRFSPYWSRIDIICPRAPHATVSKVHGNVHLHPSPWPKVLQTCFVIRQGLTLLSEHKHNLIVSHDFGFFYNGWGAWWLSRRTGVPYVSEIHHVEGYPRAVTCRERVYRAVAFWYIRWIRQRAAVIRTVNSVELPGLLRQLGVPAEKILVLPSLYIDFGIFRPMPEEVHQYDLLFVGRLASNKGLWTLLDALNQVRHTHPNLRLGILGEGPLRARIERYISSLGLGRNVHLIGPVDSPEGVARLYNQTLMLVCASTSEGGPRVTVEAMACEVAVISTPVGIMKELLEDGQTGLIFHGDATELARKVRLLLDNDELRERLAQKGRQTVQHFQAERVIGQYASGYHDLIRRLQESV